MSAESLNVSTCTHFTPAACEICRARLRELQALFERLDRWLDDLAETTDRNEEITTSDGARYANAESWYKAVANRVIHWLVINYNADWARAAMQTFLGRQRFMPLVDSIAILSPCRVHMDRPFADLVGGEPSALCEDGVETDDDDDVIRPSTPVSTPSDEPPPCPGAPMRPRREFVPPSPIMDSDSDDDLIEIPAVEQSGVPGIFVATIQRASNEVALKYGNTALLRDQSVLGAHLVFLRAKALWRQTIQHFVSVHDVRLRDEQHNICALENDDEPHVPSSTRGIRRQRRMRTVVLRHRVSSDAVESVRLHFSKNN